VAVIIDPVLDYSANNANTKTTFTDTILDYIERNKIKLKYILETHAHADHLSSAAYIQKKLSAEILIGEGIVNVQETFKHIYNLGTEFKANGKQFNALLADKQVIKFGTCELMAVHTPGHTNDSMSYVVGDCVFIGDTLFAPDYGSARCDFPGGAAETLFDSVHIIYALGADKKLYLCHDYPVNDREPKAWFYSSEQQQQNVHLCINRTKSEFIKLRKSRDEKLKVPELIIPSIQVNISAGHLPEPENNGISYLKTPLNTF
jgi:glyoxylase-like metal-dependent hydrolase (beta-lactamase superfamily II)